MAETSSLKRKLLLASRLKNDISLTMKLSDNTTDLKKWCKDSDILEFLHNDNVDLLPVDKVVNPNEIIFKLEKTNDVDEFLKLAKEADVYITKREIQGLKENFEGEKQDVFKRINEDIILGNKRFMKIKREAVRRYNDESVWYLYVAAYFLKGKAVDGTIVKAPLLLYKVDVTERNGQIVIVKKERVTTLNAKLNLFLNQTYDLDISHLDCDNFESEIVQYNSFLKTLLGKDLKELIDTQSLVEFNDYAINELTFSIEPSAVFGLMDPCGGIVLSDYEKITKSGVDPFKELSVISNANVYEQDIVNNDDIVMFDRPLNIYQKYAVKSALGESTLIFGPPGTGKSQVIATIIANILHNNKTVLMVSEKKAALDVLEERLKAIADICLFAYDTEDANYFYGKIRKLHELLNNDLNQVTLANSETTYSKIKEMYNDLRNISNIIVNNKHLDEINYVDRKDYSFSIDTIKFAANVLEIAKENNLNIIYQEYLDLFTKILENKQYFPNVLNKSDFLSLHELTNNSKNPDQIYLTFFTEHKIKKPSIFSKFLKSGISNLDLDNLKDLIEKFLDLNINQITISQISDFLSWQDKDLVKLQDEVESYLLSKKLNSMDYLSKPLLDTLSANYLANQKRMVKNVDQYIRDNYLNNLRAWIKEIEQSNDVETQNQLKELFRIASLKKSKSVNTTIKTYYTILRKLFPIWILNPIQTSQVTPCENAIFDYGIFDEASQMFFENSYPLIFRVKNSVVCGDDKQLQPIGNFVSKAFDDYNEIDDENSSIVSLFEKATTLSWPHFQLKNHYRSWSADLICFANKYIYHDEMQIITINGDFDKVVKIINVDGYLDDATQTNIVEVDAILNLLVESYKDRKDLNSSSTLVIALNNQQMDLIESEFNNKIPEICPNAYEAYKASKLMFGSVENIQGLEADEVIISLTYAKNINKQLTTNFGVMGTEGGSNRLNVAITRAVKKMTIVKSIYSKDTIMATNSDLNLFFKFIDWCDKANISPSLKDILSNDNLETKQLESEFTKDVFNYLKKKYENDKYKVLSNIPLGSKVVDICIVDKQNMNIALCICLDDYSYNYGLKKMIEELDSQKLLEDRGYKTIRIIMVDWKVRRNLVLNEIASILED